MRIARLKNYLVLTSFVFAGWMASVSCGQNQLATRPVEVPPVASPAGGGVVSQKPTKGIVKLVRCETGWQLLRDDKPYYVKGAGGSGSLEMLAKAGANSNRTWGVDNTDEAWSRLDEAEKNGLSVAQGIWLGHERHGMDYSDYGQVVQQIDQTLKYVRDLKHHPAILVWGIGNYLILAQKGRQYANCMDTTNIK